MTEVGEDILPVLLQGDSLLLSALLLRVLLLPAIVLQQLKDVLPNEDGVRDALETVHQLLLLTLVLHFDHCNDDTDLP